MYFISEIVSNSYCVFRFEACKKNDHPVVINQSSSPVRYITCQNNLINNAWAEGLQGRYTINNDTTEKNNKRDSYS